MDQATGGRFAQTGGALRIRKCGSETGRKRYHGLSIDRDRVAHRGHGAHGGYLNREIFLRRPPGSWKQQESIEASHRTHRKQFSFMQIHDKPGNELHRSTEVRHFLSSR